MICTGKRHTDYLITLINCALKGQEAPYDESIDMVRLLDLARRQQVYNTVMPVLEKAGALSEEETRMWNDYKFSELRKTIIVNNEREAICHDFEEQNIQYMFLKGLVLRDYYPMSSMRQMSDNDILYNPSRKKDVYAIMKQHGFHLEGDSAASDDFKKSCCAIDFHRELFDEEDEFHFALNLWDRAVQEENSSRYLINKEDNYLYTVCHMFKHYVTEGVGVRFLCDIYLLNTKETYDRAYIDSRLDEFHLTEFEKTVKGLCEVVFGEKEPNDNERELLSDMLTGSLFGKRASVEERVSEEGKAKYVMDRL